MDPIIFTPLYMQRVWGGRSLETNYGRTLPDDHPDGEAGEIVDRAEEQSVVEEGDLAGRTLHDLWKNRREELFGTGFPDSDRFPLLIKVLDARDDPGWLVDQRREAWKDFANRSWPRRARSRRPDHQPLSGRSDRLPRPC